MKKGSITVFLALILSLITALVCTSIESVRMAAARTQILNGMDIGLYSLFAQYDRKLLEDYDLFALDGSFGKKELDMASVYESMEAYMKPVLKQNSQKLKVKQGGFTGYRLLTDEGGEVFYNQAVKYMQETWGSQGIQLLLEKMRGREEKTKEAEKTGEKAESGDSLGNYDGEISDAAKKSQEAEEAAKNQGGDEFGDGQKPAVDSGKPEPVENPIPVIRRIMQMGILDLVIPGENGISDLETERGKLLSGRVLQQGMEMGETVKKDNSYAAQVVFQQYLMNRLGNYQEPASRGLAYQMEYILCGKDNDMDNLKSVAKKLLLVREGVNFACLMADGGRRIQAQTLALAIASAFLVPPAAAVIEKALLLCWSFAESVLDVRELFDGGKVPLVKKPSDWQLSLERLPKLLQGLDTDRKDAGSGMSYEDYLHVLLMAKGKDTKVSRAMDMVELSVRLEEGRENFRLDSCIVALEASVDVKANKRKVFNVARQYCYE